MMNYHELDRETKDQLKPLLAELRKQIYGEEGAFQENEEIIINFGKGTEPRRIVTIKVM